MIENSIGAPGAVKTMNEQEKIPGKSIIAIAVFFDRHDLDVLSDVCVTVETSVWIINQGTNDL